MNRYTSIHEGSVRMPRKQVSIHYHGIITEVLINAYMEKQEQKRTINIHLELGNHHAPWL